MAVVMSITQKREYERWKVWFEETKRRLERISRWRFIARTVLKRELYGTVWHRSRLRRRLSAARHRSDDDYLT